MSAESKEEHIKKVEEAVIRTFKKEIPSVHFSDKTKAEYEEWISKLENLYHDLLHFPPKMFDGCSLIDFGAGTGENTIQFANWGAKCTLIDASDKSCAIAKSVFDQYAPDPAEHKIHCASIFDYTGDEQYDIAYSNGVIHHTGDKEGAFSKIASFVKPGGYMVLGIGNKAGGFQNMLQRMIIYNFAKTDEEIVDLAEMLFKEDIDRSQVFSKRSRKSMIYDRFVVPKQDEPSISEVLGWFTEHNLTYYSSHPPVIPPVLADSDLNPPTFAPQDFLDVGAFTEAFWMVHKGDDRDEIPQILASFPKLSEAQFALTDYANDVHPESKINFGFLRECIANYQGALNSVDLSGYLRDVHKNFFVEVVQVIDNLAEGKLEEINKCLKDNKHLFRGANGLRHMYFIARKNQE
jgi:SAM-dependent methyltransferase